MIVTEAHLIYFSPTHTSKQVGEAIVHGIGITNFSTTDLTLKPVEEMELPTSALAVVVVPVYGGHVAPLAMERLESIRGNDTPIALVVVYGNRAYEKALMELDAFVLLNGFKVIAGATFIGEHSYSSAKYPIAAGRPDSNDLELAVEFKHTGAMVKLAKAHLCGLGVECVTEKAMRLFEKAAKMGNTDGMVEVARCLSQESSVESDESKAMDLLTRAAKQGNAQAMLMVGLMMIDGECGKEDKEGGIGWLKEASEHGNVMAMRRLGECFENGDGVAQDTGKALEMYEKASDNGDDESMKRLAWHFETGSGVSIDLDKAHSLYTRAFHLPFDNPSDEHHGPENNEMMMSVFERMASNGHSLSMFTLGKCYYHGKGVTQDKVKAFEWYLKSAQNGNALAMNNVGWCFNNGQGVTQDKTKAFEWFLKSAQNGNADAMFNVGC